MPPPLSPAPKHHLSTPILPFLKHLFNPIPANLLPNRNIAGSDTTSSAIRTNFLNILSTPRVPDRLRAEFTALVPPSLSSLISDADARRLPYLQAMIKEGTRPVPSLLWGWTTIYAERQDTVATRCRVAVLQSDIFIALGSSLPPSEDFIIPKSEASG
jgi:hypothetical protein